MILVNEIINEKKGVTIRILFQHHVVYYKLLSDKNERTPSISG